MTASACPSGFVPVTGRGGDHCCVRYRSDDDAWVVLRPAATSDGIADRPARLSRGVVVALVGPDGVGKTTLVDALVAALPLPVHRVHLGLWRRTGLSAALGNLPLMRTVLVLARLLSGAAGAAWHRRHAVVLLDRCAFDLDVEPAPRTARGRAIQALVRRLSPRPDVTVVLDAPARVLVQRKPEHSLAVARRRREGYLSLVSTRRAAAVVDTTADPAEATRAVTALLWRALDDRHRSAA
jgi:thymidylate kinase